MPGLPDTLYQAQHSSLQREEVEVERRSRLCVVPKDFRGHRLICIEPKELMFYQQGLLRTINHIVKTNLITRSCINFSDQSISFNLSKRLNLSTIDLSDASDRLRKELCRFLFPKEVFSVLANARCNTVELPDGEIIVPTTMYTMGNALCFPIETLVFWALTLSTMLHEDGQVWRVDNPRGLLAYLRKNRLQVFGDDIIVPNRHFNAVCNTLACSGLLVNVKKSCLNTPIREACGSWYAFGIDCRIVKLKVDNVETYVDWISARESVKLLFQSGFTHAANLIKAELDRFYCIPIDGMQENPDAYKHRRYNVQLQRVEFRVPEVTLGQPSVLDGEVGLYSYFTGRGSHAGPLGNASCVKWGWRSQV